LFAAIFILRSTRALTLIGFAGKVAAAFAQSAANHHQPVINQLQRMPPAPLTDAPNLRNKDYP
jgi:hypothetical protein